MIGGSSRWYTGSVHICSRCGEIKPVYSDGKNRFVDHCGLLQHLGTEFGRSATADVRMDKPA